MFLGKKKGMHLFLLSVKMLLVRKVRRIEREKLKFDVCKKY